jgi:hypothetical protein
VSFYHTTQSEEIAHPLVSRDAEPLGGSGIVEELNDLTGQVGGISGFECTPGISEDFDEGAEIGGQNGDSAKHVFSNDHTKNFAAERGNDQKVGCGEEVGDLRIGEPPEKAHLHGELPFCREFLKSGALRAIADDLQFDRAILPLQQAPCFEEQKKSFGRNNAAQKDEHWDWVAGGKPHKRGRWRETMGNGFGSRQLEHAGQPVGWRYVRSDMLAKEPPKEGEQPETKGRKRLGSRRAGKAMGVAFRHEMAGAGDVFGFLEQLPSRANGLKTVVFHDNRFSQHKSKQDGRNGGTGHVDHICGANEFAECIETGLTHDRERKQGIVERAAWSLGHECQLKLALRAGLGAGGQFRSERHHYGFHATNARRKEMRIEQELHDQLFLRWRPRTF